MSNVTGPRGPLMLLGRRVCKMLFWVPHPSGLSCGVSLLSYDGVVHIGVRSDDALIPDPERLTHLFERELSAWEDETSCSHSSPHASRV